MSKHINLFETKTKEELLQLYGEFLESEKALGISNDTELDKIRTEYVKDFGTNAVLMLQIELTHTVANLWYKENTTNFHSNESYDFATLADWYINSVSSDDTPVWTEEHIEELLNDFYVIPKSNEV